MKGDFFFQFHCGCGRWLNSYGLLCSPAFVLNSYAHTHNLFIIFYIEVQTMRFACQNMIFHFFIQSIVRMERANGRWISAGRTLWLWWATVAEHCSYEWTRSFVPNSPSQPILPNIQFNHFSKMKKITFN